jgi:hypothetical protein
MAANTHFVTPLQSQEESAIIAEQLADSARHGTALELQVSQTAVYPT